MNQEPRKEPYLKSKIKKYSPDLAKIRELGWGPRFSLEGGFLKTLRSYQDG